MYTCTLFAMFRSDFCPSHSHGFWECAQIHLPRKVYSACPVPGPRFRLRGPARSVGGQGEPWTPADLASRSHPGRGYGQHRACAGVAGAGRPRPCPAYGSPPGRKPRRRALPLCTPASGVPPDTLRRESLPCTRPNRRSWPPRSPQALTGIRENPRFYPRIFNTSPCLISWLVIPLHIRRGSRAP